MKAKSYRDLIVWQKAMDIVELVYHATENFPKVEQYGLASQMRRAAVSVPSNIAEGQSRHSTKEFISFLSIARGSNAEIETQLIIAVRLNFLNQTDADIIFDKCAEVGKMLNSLIASLESDI